MRIDIRPLARSDFPTLARWLSADHVHRWWRETATEEYVEHKYGPRVDGTSPTRVFVAGHEGAPFGLIQFYRLHDHPDWQRTLGSTGRDEGGIDYLIGEAGMIGRGFGTELIRAFSERMFGAEPALRAIIVTPQAENAPSCRALAAAGYRLVEIRKLDSDDPSDSGPSAIYRIDRDAVAAHLPPR